MKVKDVNAKKAKRQGLTQAEMAVLITIKELSGRNATIGDILNETGLTMDEMPRILVSLFNKGLIQKSSVN